MAGEDKNENPKKKFDETLKSIASSDKIEELCKYAKTNRADTMAYVAMILGILILFFEPFYGGTLIGTVTGLYFSREILTIVRDIEGFIERLGMVRSLIFGGLLIALFVAAPAIFISAAVTILLKQLILPDKADLDKE